MAELLSCRVLIMCVKLKIFHLALAGLKAGDEILEINNRAADALNSSMLKDFLSQPSLGLLVRTYPELEEGVELLESPPHRVDGPADLGESPLAFLTSNPGMTVRGGARGESELRSATTWGFITRLVCFSECLCLAGGIKCVHKMC